MYNRTFINRPALKHVKVVSEAVYYKNLFTGNITRKLTTFKHTNFQLIQTKVADHKLCDLSHISHKGSQITFQSLNTVSTK